jgi:hypothetical protein
MIGTLQALGLGGMYQRPKMGVYVDNNGRQWQTNEVEMEVVLEKDAEGNAIPLLDSLGLHVHDPTTRVSAVYATHRSKDRKTIYATCDDVGASTRTPTR